MDFSQLMIGAKVAIGAGIALAASPFLHWYGVAVDVPGYNFNAPLLKGWEIFTYTDIALFVAGVCVLALGLQGAVDRLAGLRVPSERLVAGIGAVALVLGLHRALRVPGPAGAELTRESGVVVALVGAGAAVFAGTRLQWRSG